MVMMLHPSEKVFAPKKKPTGLRRFTNGVMLGMTFTVLFWRVLNEPCIGTTCWVEAIEEAIDSVVVAADTTATQLTTMVDSQKGISLTPTTVITGKSGKCVCQLTSPDCLSSIACIPQGPESKAVMAVGILTRQVIQEKAKFRNRDDPVGEASLENSLEISTIRSWELWTKKNSLPFRYLDTKDKHVHHTQYPHCVDKKLKGKNCFFRALTHPEDFDTMEEDAIDATTVPPDLKFTVKKDLVRYRELQRRKRPDDLPALGHLLTLAHLLRLRVNRRTHLKEFYKQHLQTQVGKDFQDGHKLKVSLHIPGSSDLHLYMDALEQLQFMTGRPLEVYLSTTNNRVLDQIEDRYQQLIHRFSWKYLAIPMEESKTSHAQLAELWLLSNGEVFVAGKVGLGWLLATARYNRFVPYLSIDGKSICDDNKSILKCYLWKTSFTK